jgi:hypothetical protein
MVTEWAKGTDGNLFLLYKEPLLKELLKRQ